MSHLPVPAPVEVLDTAKLEVGEWPENTQHFSVNEIHGPHRGPQLGPQENMQVMVYDVPAVRSSPSLGRSWAKIQLIPTFDLQLLGLRVVMNIINGIARGGSPYVPAPPSLAPEERMMCEREHLQRWSALNA